jgi:heptosyltransferase-2
VDERLVFDKRGAHAGISGLRRMAAELAAKRFDLALCPHPSLRSSLLVRLARIPRRIGFSANPGARLFTTRVPRDARLHEVRRVLSLLGPLGGAPDGLVPRLVPDRAAEASARAKIEALGIRPGDRVAGVHPFSVWGTKRWLPERFAAVIDALAGRGLRVLLIGGPADRADADALLAHVRSRPADAVGALGLRELLWATRDLAVFVTGDSGPMHIAAALGVPVVAIFGSTVPAQGYAPYTTRAAIVEAPLDCRPCGRHGHARCPLGHFRCMREIKVADVLAGVDLALAAR